MQPQQLYGVILKQIILKLFIKERLLRGRWTTRMGDFSFRLASDDFAEQR